MKRNLFSTSMLIDVSQIDHLRFIRRKNNRIEIGALTTHQEIVDSEILVEVNPALVSAAKTIGCEQTRNRGTLGGNIANASPAADTIPPLLVFNADVHILGVTAEKTISLDDFLVGPGQTKLVEGELIRSVSFKLLTGGWGTSFIKLGKRNGMAISVVSAAALLRYSADGKIAQARISLGSVAPRVIRSPNAERILIGQYPTSKILEEASRVCIEDISPISDIRSSAEYRRRSAKVIVNRVLSQAVQDASRRQG
jgi:carbon-monoxide dehydrogenase medium subunit